MDKINEEVSPAIGMNTTVETQLLQQKDIDIATNLSNFYVNFDGSNLIYTIATQLCIMNYLNTGWIIGKESGYPNQDGSFTLAPHIYMQLKDLQQSRGVLHEANRVNQLNLIDNAKNLLQVLLEKFIEIPL